MHELREKHAHWKSQLVNLESELSAAKVVRLSSDRQVLAAQIFSFRPPGPLLQPRYFKLDQFASRLRQQLTAGAPKALIRLLLNTEKQIGYILAEIIWIELAQKVKQGCQTGANCTFDWELYLDSGLDPAELRKDSKLVIHSSNPKLLHTLKKVLDPSDTQLFCQALQGPEESGKQILPQLRPSNRHIRITKVNPSNFPYLPLPLSEECRNSLVAASVDHMLQCAQPAAVLQSIEKYLGVSQSQLIAKAIDRIFNLHPNSQHLPLLQESLKSQPKALNQIITSIADNNLPLSKKWQKFLVQESNDFTLLPLLVLHEPASWQIICSSMCSSKLQKNLQNTLLASLKYPVQVKNWDTAQLLLEQASKLRHTERHSPGAEGSQIHFPYSGACEEFPLLQQNPPASCLRLLANLRTSPPRIIRDQLVVQGLLDKKELWIKLGKKTAKTEQKFIEEHVNAETKPQDLTFFAKHLPYQRKLLLETFLQRLSTKSTPPPLCSRYTWFKEKEQVHSLEQLVHETVASFPECQESLLAYLVRCNLIQSMPSLAPLLVGQEQLLRFATEENLEYLLNHDAYTGIKPELGPLLNYRDPLKTIPFLHRAGIDLDDHEFWQLVGKANENTSLIPLIKQVLERKAPKTVDSDTIAELTESHLIALLVGYGVLQPSDTLDGRPMFEWLDKEDLFEVLCRINLGTDHPLLVNLAAQEPETAWQIVQKTIQTNHARENLAAPCKLELELF